ncbi:MAG: hypothetical protein ACJA1L_000017 [Paracoccaceae bacterium]|jgi:hypothetical protein
MAVVTSSSDLFPPDPLDQPMPSKLAGILRHAIGSVACAATDSANSMYRLAQLPSVAIMHPETLFDVEAWGFAQVVIGSKEQTDAILDVAKSAATTQSPFAWGDANHGLELWQVLGLAADPGGFIDIYAHAEAGATGAGSMPFCIAWVDNR